MQEASERLGQLTRPEDPAQAGTQTGGTAPDAGERQEDFEELIRGRYKADFDARVKKILDGRLRGLRQEVTDLRQREKLRQVQIQYYLDRLPEQEKQVPDGAPGVPAAEGNGEPPVFPAGAGGGGAPGGL